MNQLIESLRRLYAKDKIDNLKLNELLKKNKINQQEYNYIISVTKVV